MSNLKNLSREKIFLLALESHKKNNLKKAEKLYGEILKNNPNHVDTYNNLGILYNQKGNLQKAIYFFEKAIKINSNNSATYNNIGFIYNQLKEYNKAILSFERAIQINTRDSSAYYNLGNTYKELAQYQKAISCYEKAIEINPKYVEVYNNLGNIHKELDQYQKAISCYEKAIKINPKYVGVYNNLGNINKETGNIKKAIEFYENAIKLRPDHFDSYNNLGNIFKEQGQYQKAIDFYEKAIDIKPNFFAAHNNLGNNYKEMNQYQKAIECFEKAIEINPNDREVYNNLGNIYKELGDYTKAINCYDTTIKIDPNNLTAHWLSMNIFPIVYKNSEELNIYRKKFEKSINKINLLLDKNSDYTKRQFFQALNSSTNFYLHYQGKDDLVLQKSYAYLIERITKLFYKKFYQEKKINRSSKFIKVGFVSSYFRNHTISKLFKNWIIKLDGKYFKKSVYYVDNKFDHFTQEIEKNVDYFYNHTDVDHIISHINDDDIDVLVYLDIGMSPKIQILSSLRLASIQCCTWGHPVSSGFKNIDYYLSGNLMETENSQKYYSEKLINLPNLGIDYDFPNLSNIQKPKIHKDKNVTIFLNLQNLFKLLPQDDHIYLDIVKKYSNCCFWFINGLNDEVTSIFKQRIYKLFNKEGYDYQRYFYFHPKCNQDEFFGLIKESDIILDSINWSGGNTSLEAISLNKPIVTMPTNFMRGRHTYGILKILDIENTIAYSKEEYVKISIKLALDKNFRNSIINKIKKNKNIIFNDNNPIKFLEEFIKKIISDVDNV